MKLSLFMNAVHTLHNEIGIDFRAFDDPKIDAIAQEVKFSNSETKRLPTGDDLANCLICYNYAEDEVASFRIAFSTLVDFNNAVRKFGQVNMKFINI